MYDEAACLLVCGVHGPSPGREPVAVVQKCEYLHKATGGSDCTRMPSVQNCCLGLLHIICFPVQDAVMSSGSGYGASAVDDSPANRSWDADSRHRHAAQHSQRSSSLAVPTDSSRHAGNRASSQQSKQQNSDPAQQMYSRHDHTGSGPPDHLQAKEMPEHHSLDLDKPRTGQGSGQLAAGPTVRQRPQHQEHQHRFESANDNRWPAEGSEKRQARDFARPAAKPYATDQS